MELGPWLGSVREEVEGWLGARLQATEGPPRLKEAMGYSLLGGGKRLRAALVVAAAEACGAEGRSRVVQDMACALEMVHAYSLIHDDLPAMDDDDLRRGRPTSHKVFGEALAILAGDALLTEAFSVLAGGQAHAAGHIGVGAAGAPGEQSALRPADAAIRLALVRRLGRDAGAVGMVGGQALDIGQSAAGAGLAAVEDVHARKTGALIACACAGGAQAAGAAPDLVDRLDRFGRAAGLAFQVADDVLDATGEAAALGKAVGKDADRGTATVPGEIGLDAARDRARALTDLALSELAPLGARADRLAALARRLIDREA